MSDTLLFLAAPVTASVLIAGMLGYFGTHILTRKIIFIDISVAQIAAVGTMIGLLLGFAEEAFQVQFFSYFLTLLVIGFFAMLRTERLPIPSEAVIGIIYCLGLALALLLAEKIPGGSNFITKTITGNILWITWKKVFNLGLLFAVIGGIHILLGRQFLQLTLYGGSEGNGLDLKRRLLNLLFYVSFGLVVVKTVQIGGIFLVFTLLIAPAVAASMLVEKWRARLYWSWIIGLAGTVAGIFTSYLLNISNGPAIVCILGTFAFVVAFVRIFKPTHAS
jgi:zinc/manganese transport system permease protein